MRVQQIATKSFRNLRDQTIEPSVGLNVICGDNGQGKTNFLEAVFLVASLRSFRTRRLAELVRFGAELAGVHAVVEDQGLFRNITVEAGRQGKRVLLDGKALRGPGVCFGQLRVVIFQPEDLWVPRGSPGERRHLIDAAITVVWPAYFQVLRDYQRVLRSRNQLLRQPAAGEAELREVYDQQLSELGAKVVASRQRYLSGLQPRFARAFGEIFRWEKQGSLRYSSRPAVLEAAGRLEDLCRVLRRELRENRSLDLQRQVTSVGPHTDDLDFLLNGRSARSFGSQGQVRGLMLAFRMAQLEDAYAKGGSYPVLLLDDVSSELDPVRSQRLFEFIEAVPSQTFVTTTRAALIPLSRDRMDFHMVDGLLAGTATGG